MYLYCFFFSFTQFRFSDKLDVVLMILGTLSAAGHGSVFPLSIVIFGELSQSFIQFAKGQGEVTGNITQPIFDLEGEMTKFALYYVYLAIATLILAYGEMTLWSLTATRQEKKCAWLSSDPF